MASEAVQVIVSAEDQASQKFAQIAANAEQELGRVKTAGEKVKGVAGTGGVLAQMLGGTEIGQSISKIGELTEKVNQFGAIAREGGASAMLFKGGLTALVAVISFELGKSIGEMIWGVDKAKQEFDDAAESIKNLNSELLKIKADKFASDLSRIDIAPTVSEQKKLLDGLFKELKRSDEQLSERIATLNARAEELRNTFDITDISKQNADVVQNEANLLVEQLNQTRQQQRELQKAYTEKQNAIEKSFNSSMQQLNAETIALTEGDSAAQKYLLKIQGFSDAQISWLVGLRESNAELKKANGEKENQAKIQQKVNDLFSSAAASIQQQRIALTQGEEAARVFSLTQQGMTEAMAERIAEEEKENRLQSIRQKTNQQLEERKILLNQGAEAARSFALQQEGLSKAEADRIAKEEATLNALEEEKRKAEELQKKLAQGPGSLSAVESRLLTRGPSANPMLQVANQQLQTQTRIAVATEKSAAAKGMQVRFVGGGAFRA